MESYHSQLWWNGNHLKRRRILFVSSKGLCHVLIYFYSYHSPALLTWTRISTIFCLGWLIFLTLSNNWIKWFELISVLSMIGYIEERLNRFFLRLFSLISCDWRAIFDSTLNWKRKNGIRNGRPWQEQVDGMSHTVYKNDNWWLRRKEWIFDILMCANNF
jgi:hypothetical protein